jgi:hypothetical protein
LAQLPVPALESLQTLRHLDRDTGAAPALDPGLLDPPVRRLGAQPIFDGIDTIADQRDPCWPSWSSTIRTARSRTSGKTLFVVLLMRPHPAQELKPPANPARFT